ncbi:bleomycin resistance protein [Dryocola sp. BD626]|uniref:bleomycin resistance protein n=1 Tax=Dryocola sp. BD626 TaxID=3133273 RepID=UPI003F500709
MTKENIIYWNRMVPELTVYDFSASIRFYVEMLGFEIMIRRNDPEFAYISLGEAQLMLEQYHPEGWITGDLINPLGRGVNFQIEVDDITTLYSSLKANNVLMFRTMRDNEYNIGNTLSCQREFLVQDPDGYLLRFCQYIEEKNV